MKQQQTVLPQQQQYTFPTTLLLASLSGLFGGFSYAPLPLGWMAWICFVPLLMALNSSTSRKQTFAILYTCFFLYHGAANWWVMSWQSQTDPFLMAAGAALWLLHPFFFMPPIILYRYIHRTFGTMSSLIFFPLLWVAFEWLHSLSDASYPWIVLGYSQAYYTNIIQIADVGGVWILSGITVAMSAILYWWVLQRQITYRSLSCAVLLLAIPLLYSYFTARYTSVPPATSKPLPIVIVQPNINPWSKWTGSNSEMVDKHIALADSLQSALHQTSPAIPHIVLWSETAIPSDLNSGEGEEHFRRIRTWCDTTASVVLTGFADFTYYYSEPIPFNARGTLPGVGYTVHNAALLISPNSTPESAPVHHKSRLTPFGEGIPFSDDVPWLRSLLTWGVGISAWNKGSGATVLPAIIGNDTLARIGPVICIESIYPSYVADYTRKGATVLVVITNDAWYDGTFGPEQHFCIARLRAVENRRWIARCGNSGVSGFISPRGESVNQQPTQQALACEENIYPSTALSLYVRFGDWFPIGSTIVSVLMLLLSAYYTKKRSYSV